MQPQMQQCTALYPAPSCDGLTALAVLLSSSPQGVDGKELEGTTITWTSVDRLNMSIGLLYALCNHALDSGIR